MWGIYISQWKNRYKETIQLIRSTEKNKQMEKMKKKGSAKKNIKHLGKNTKNLNLTAITSECLG